MEKRVLDITTKHWKPEEVEKMKIAIRDKNYKYQLKIQQPDGQIKYAYTNDEPELLKVYLEKAGAKLLEIKRLI